jgi:hypothetical protein
VAIAQEQDMDLTDWAYLVTKPASNLDGFKILFYVGSMARFSTCLGI